MGLSSTNLLVFPIPNSLRLEYEADPMNVGLFDGDFLKLPVQSEDYQFTQLRQNPSVIMGLSQSFIKIENSTVEIQATIKDSRDTITYILDELKALALPYPYTSYNLITMHDYHRLDTATDRTLGYTTRKGVLDYEFTGGTFRSEYASNSYRYNTGIRIIFKGV